MVAALEGVEVQPWGDKIWGIGKPRRHCASYFKEARTGLE